MRKNIIIMVIIIFALCSCTKEKNNEIIYEEIFVETIEEEINDTLSSEIDFYSVIINSDAIAALVNTDIVDIRNASTVKGEIIGKHNFGDLILIYEIRENYALQGTLPDYWYRISEFEDKWVNGLNILSFPFYIPSIEKNYDFRSSYHKAFESIMKFESFEIIDENIYLKSRSYSFPLAETLVIEDNHFVILDNKHTNFLKLVNDFKT